MFKSIPLEDQQTICNFDVSNVPVILNTTELDPIEGIEESLGHNSSPNTSIQSSVEWLPNSNKDKRLKLE